MPNKHACDSLRMVPAYPVAADSPSVRAVVCPDRFTAGRGFLFDLPQMTKPKRKAVSIGKPGSELVARQVGTAYVERPKRVPLPGEAVIPEGLVIQRYPVPVGRYELQPGEAIAGGFMSDWQAKRGAGA